MNFWGLHQDFLLPILPGEHVSNSTHIAIPNICQHLIYGGFLVPLFNKNDTPPQTPPRARVRFCVWLEGGRSDLQRE